MKQAHDELLNEAIKTVATYRRDGESAVDYLLAERRREAAMEEDEVARYLP